MTKLLVLALCVCLVMSMSVKERLEKSAESQEENCDSKWIGDGVCNYQCYYEEYKFDGGDCCQLNLIGDGICDDACNFEKHKFDGGDCA